MQRTGGVSPGAFRCNRQTRTLQCATSPSPLGSALMLKQKEKNEGLGLISLALFSRKLRHSLSKNYITLFKLIQFCVPFVSFKTLKCFNLYFLEKLREGFCLPWGAHLIFPVRSPLLEAGLDSEASSPVCAPSDGTMYPGTELGLQPLPKALRSSALLCTSPHQEGRLGQRMQDMRMYLKIKIWELCSPADPQLSKLPNPGPQNHCWGFYHS